MKKPLSAGFVFFCVCFLLFWSCGPENRDRREEAEYVYYKDVPGVTVEEVAAIEALARSTSFFTYGMLQSTECFRNENNMTNGFAALVCQWLSEFFGIRFRPVIYNWDALLKGIADYSISFSGEISSSLDGYYMTNSIAERKIQFVSTEGSDRLAIASSSRVLKYGFLEGTTTKDLVSPGIRQEFTAVPVANYTDAYQKLIVREIDALFMDETVEGIFSLYNNLIIEDFQPLTYNRVSLATCDPRLQPVISVVQKYLEVSGSYRFAQMYDSGLESYLKYNLWSRLTFEERHYVEEHRNVPVPVAIESDNYPVSFYNEREKEWQGIAVDTLAAIEKLSTIRFSYVASSGENSPRAPNGFDKDSAVMTTEMIRSAFRDQNYLLASFPYETDYYAFISSSDMVDVTMSDIPYKKIGIVRGTVYGGIFRELFPNHRNTVEYKDRTDAINGLLGGEIDLLMGTRNLLLSITNYMEKTGYRANLVLQRPYESAFGIRSDQVILGSIINKTQPLINTNRIVDSWTRRVFDYSGALARSQKPFLIGAAVLMGAALCLVAALFFRNRYIALNLERIVKQRTHELEVQSAAAKIASQAKGEFLARMSHEIRTPLNAVIGMTTIARKAKTLEKKDRSLREIDTASNHLLGILNDVLDMSKIESGKFAIVLEALDLDGAMKEVRQIIALRCREKSIDFTVDVSLPGESWVMGDKLRLKQVLINLLGNAVKFTGVGGNITFSVQGREENGKLRVDFLVSDTGIGMKEEQMENLFNAFEQADDTIAVRYGGTGLGLAISQTLVKLMGGLISVKSEYGRGSAFSFTLYMERAAAGADSEAPPENIPDLSGKRILLAEDIEINRIILKELLGETHVLIDEAEDGKEAFDKFSASRENWYDLVFMDVQMPNMNGHEATKKIRALDRSDAGKVPIIAMTANAYREDIDKALAAGMNGHLAKPVDMEEVRKVLFRWLVRGSAD
ncbi:MAG: response regulator [Treponema sp.]|jgi:signal transduction histidine kinase/ActR/RegA family two-component response regulator|nr:response regulator [Treponema sp.]